MGLVTAPNIPDPDAFQARLAALHAGLSAEQSLVLNARIILLLANQIGEQQVLEEVLAVAAARPLPG